MSLSNIHRHIQEGALFVSCPMLVFLYKVLQMLQKHLICPHRHDHLHLGDHQVLIKKFISYFIYTRGAIGIWFSTW
uniref:Putative ovule protein n=1 Tax=Solanum chacoense TaxID=4108 RepID=A0A0V0HEF7_SOLCH